MKNDRLPKRNEVPVQETWRLEDLFETNEAWMTEYESLKTLPSRIQELQGKLGNSSGNLLAGMKLQDEIMLRLEPLFTYANSRSDEDTGNNYYQDMAGSRSSCFYRTKSAR